MRAARIAGNGRTVIRGITSARRNQEDVIQTPTAGSGSPAIAETISAN